MLWPPSLHVEICRVSRIVLLTQDTGPAVTHPRSFWDVDIEQNGLKCEANARKAELCSE